jgi:folate-binding protein YgfZ
MNLQSVRYQCSQKNLNDWTVIKVTGADRETFFQGQVTNDLSLIKENEGQCTARLNRSGKVQSFFYIAKQSDHLLILCPSELAEYIKNDFEKFIIMDDVELEILQVKPWIIFNPFLVKEISEQTYFDFNFYGIMARFVFNKLENVQTTDEKELEKIRILNGWPKWDQDISDKHFINDSYLNEVAISYKKGCFLGQETVAKIENNRGAAYYPMLLQLESSDNLSIEPGHDFLIEDRKAGTLNYQVENYLQVSLFRDFRIVGKKINFLLADKTYSATVMELPFYKAFNRHQIALELYHSGVDLFQNNDSKGAIEALKQAIKFDPAFADPYESLGVILGRHDKFDEAIEWMNQLLTVNPQSVMAHTNKSLYLMKLGKIEEAEAEKSLATVKSFAMFGSEAKLKKQLEEEQKKKEDDLLRREKMFLQVLEIDPDDSIALYGMADIFFFRKEFELAATNLKKVVAVDPKYSNAYLLLGKAYEAQSKTNDAKEIYQQGIHVASKQGDMMPANEMQSRLNQLVVSAGLN